MKKNIWKPVTMGIGVLMAAVIVSLAVMNSGIEAEAADTFLGIQNLITEVSQEYEATQEKYTILEVVPDRSASEIGYFFDGYEPALSVWDDNEKRWKGWREQLAECASETERRELIEGDGTPGSGLKAKLQAYYNKQGITNGPVSIAGEYAESTTEQEGFERIDFNNAEQTGWFEAKSPSSGENEAGYQVVFLKIDDYSLNSGTAYYKVGNATLVDESNKESISTSASIYKKTTENGIEYYVYYDIWGNVNQGEDYDDAENGDDESAEGESGEGDNIETVVFSSNSVSDNSSPIDDDTDDDTDDDADDESSVSDNAAQIDVIPLNDSNENNSNEDDPKEDNSSDLTREIENQGYYTVTFEVIKSDTQLQENESVYIADEQKIQRNNAAEYTFCEGTIAEGGQKYDLGQKNIYVKTIFANQEWFKKHVLSMTEEEYASFPVEVISYTPEELNQMEVIPDFDFLYINSGKSADLFYDTNVDISVEVGWMLFSKVQTGLPCLIDGNVIFKKADSNAEVEKNQTISGTNIFKLCTMLCQDSVEGITVDFANADAETFWNNLAIGHEDGNFTTGHVYCHTENLQSIVNDNFGEYTIYKEGEVIPVGFQKVLDEIELENLYRMSDVSGEYKPLSTDISQATVIRHIMNYINRRNEQVKENISVLEIQPAKTFRGEPELTLDQIQKWAPEVKSADITVMTTAEFIGKVESLNDKYDLIYIGTCKDYMNTQDGITVFNDTAMNGLVYYHTGDMRIASMELAGQLDNEYKGNNRSNKLYYYNPVRYGGNDITLEKKKALLSFLDASYPIIVSDEFFGESGSTDTGLVTLYNGNDYTGASAAFGVGRYDMGEMERMGIRNDQLRSIKVPEGYTVTLYWDSNFGGSSRVITADTPNLGRIGWDRQASSLVVEHKEQVILYTDENYRGTGAAFGIGRYNMNEMQSRGIGNDQLSSIKVPEGYKVTLYWDIDFGGNSLEITADTGNLGVYPGWNNQATSFVVESNKAVELERAINENCIDNCSYMYEFATEALSKNNFYARSEITDDSDLFKFYLGRPKVSIGNLRANGIKNQNGVYEINMDSNGRYLLEYRFSIINEGAASADTKYGCKLLIDVNADGKYSDLENLSDITITQNGNAVSPNELYAGKEYVLRRYVPDGYKGVLPWKVQISQVNNPNIYSGARGYTKLLGQERETIDILQICRREDLYWGENADALLNLEERIATTGDIYNVLIYGGYYGGVYYEGIYKDFDINVDFVLIEEYEERFREYKNNNKNLLDDYNMLILGFSDAYGEIYDNEALDAIVKFIESGKSVLFAHDTVSYFNHDKAKQDEQGYIYREGNDTGRHDQTVNAFTLTKAIRGLVGMDSYGITSFAPLKAGNTLNTSSPYWKQLQALGKDIAYVPKSNKTQAFGLTQGYTYSIISAKDRKAGDPGSQISYFTQNQCGITGGFTNVYTNLKYDRVYYYDDQSCEDGEINIGHSNAEVSNLWVTKVNDGQITEYPYKLSDEFMVSNTHGQYYQLDFMADDDGDGQTDLVVWFCLGGRTNGNTRQETIYSMSPNDVANNYYIYNKGNITYTGVGHAGDASTVDEAKLFINTMIASYNAGMKSPYITILEGPDAGAAKQTVLYRYFDDEFSIDLDGAGSAVDSYEKIYFTVRDDNFVKGSRKIAVHVFYDAADGTQTIDGSDVPVKELKLNGTVFNAADNSVANPDNLQSSGVYYIKVPEELLATFDTGDKFYFEAQSIITSNNNVLSTDKAYANLEVLKTYLFDLN